MELELRQAGGRVAMVQLLPILRQYSSSSATRRNLASRSRPSNCSTICLRPAGLEKESSSSASSTTTTTTRSATICLRRGSFEVQQGCNCIPAGGDVELLIGGQRWDDAPTGQQFGIGDMNFGPQQRRCLSQSDMKFLLISGLQPHLNLRKVEKDPKSDLFCVIYPGVSKKRSVRLSSAHHGKDPSVRLRKNE